MTLRGRKRKILEAFLESPTHELTTAQLCQPDVGGARFGARIHELEHKHGCHFHARQLRQGSWVYKLVSWPRELVEVGAASPSADPGDPLPPDGRSTDGDLAGAVSFSPSSGEAPSLFDPGSTLGHDQEAAA